MNVAAGYHPNSEVKPEGEEYTELTKRWIGEVIDNAVRERKSLKELYRGIRSGE